jgi:hypothetical protein
MIHKVVLVVWDDAYVTDSDGSDDAVDVPFQCVTVGFLLSRSRTAVKVAAELLPDGSRRGVTRIPAGCLVSMRVLGKVQI